MKPALLLVAFLLLAITIKSGLALTCQYDSNPSLSDLPLSTSRFYFSCNSTMNGYSCMNYLTLDGEVLQVNPEPESTPGIGVIDRFSTSSRQILQYYREDKNIVRAGFNYTVWVMCSNNATQSESSNFTIIPNYESLDQPVYAWLYVKNNMGLIFGAIFLLILIGAVIILLLRGAF